MHRWDVQKDDMGKRVAALQRQLAASQSSAMQAQFAHEEFKVCGCWNAPCRETHPETVAAMRHAKEQLHLCIAQEIAQDEEEIRELKARVKDLEGQLATCRGGGDKGKADKSGRKDKRHLQWRHTS